MRLAFLFVLLFASSASAQTTKTDRIYNATLVYDFSWHVADIEVTRDCLNRGTCREANPVLRWAQDKPGVLGIAKGVAAGTVHTLIHRKLWKRGHKWEAIAANAVVGGVTTYVTLRNMRY